MWSKIYLAVLGLSVAAMAFFSFYSWSWLQSIGLPAAAVAGYEYHSSLAWPALWITSGLLLLLGNAMLWASGRAWALWTTFLYFGIAASVRYFWLDPAFFAFRRNSSLTEASFTGGPFFAVMLIVFMALAVFADQFIVTRLREKTYPKSSNEVVPEVAK